MSIADIVFKNEEERRSTEEIREYLALIDKIMQSGIERGCQTKGTLPGGLGILRRAPIIYHRLEEKFHANDEDPLMIVDWINLWRLPLLKKTHPADKLSRRRRWGLLEYFRPF